MKLVPGTLFARDFRVVSALAEGGMGAVYIVEQLSTGKRRALKVMQPALIPDARARERFVLEARIGSQIESEHVVDVVASGIDEPTGMPWIAMELLEGVDLADYVKQRERLTPAETYEVIAQLCEGLGSAHARGIVHRDLKPENVFISSSKRRGVPFIVKILDFGIAKVTHENQTSATGTSAMGSPLWMAPEQTESGTRLRPSTDVWALGLMAFWMLTGRSYWRAGNQAEIALTPIFTEVLVLPLEAPSVRAAQLGLGHLVPATFDPWFMRCVARSHEHRFVDATQAIAALTPQFSMVEASSARRMIPATVAMPSIAPGALPVSSAAMTTPVPRTSVQPSIEPPSSPHIYLPQPTEPTPAFVAAAGAPPQPVMPYGPTSFVPGAYTPSPPGPQGTPGGATAPMHVGDGGWAPTQLSQMAGAPTAEHAARQPSHPPYGSMQPSHPPYGSMQPSPAPYGSMQPSPAPYGSMQPSPSPSTPGLVPASHAGSIAAPTPYMPPAPYAHAAPPRAASTGGTVRWGVLGAVGAILVLGAMVMAGLAVILLWPGSGTGPPPPTTTPDAALALPDAGTDAWVAIEDAGSDAAVAVRGRPGVGPVDDPGRELGAGDDPEPSAEAEPLPDGADRRFTGSWSGDGWRYRLMIDLARDGTSIAGAIRWTLAETPDPMYTARIGETATEYVRGTFSAPGLISLDGQSVTDDSLISADHYDLHLAADGSIVGAAREGGGRLTARMLE